MKHIDLFSGIGGFALAASWVWPEHKVVAFCEIDPFCQRVLRKHWPDAIIHDDIRIWWAIRCMWRDIQELDHRTWWRRYYNRYRTSQTVPA